jgi:hypothetical protein
MFDYVKHKGLTPRSNFTHTENVINKWHQKKKIKINEQ